jgi:VanZ family protein
MTIKNLLAYNRLILFIAIFWTFFILYLCLVNTNDLPVVDVKGIKFDKIVHFFFHFVFTFLWIISKKNYNNFAKRVFMIILFSVLYGISIEIAQKMLTTSRNADLYDVFANTLGSLTAAFILIHYNRKKMINHKIP